MRDYLARLGNFQFGMDTAAFSELKRASAWRWEQKNRIGREPAMQHTGRDADTVSLSGVIYPHWRGGLGQLAALRALAGTGEPQPLVYAFENVGQYCGRWCIVSVDETRTVFFENGTPRKIEFSLSLVEYGEDSAAATVASAAGTVAGSVNASGSVSAAASVQSAAAAVTTQAGALGMLQRAASVANTVATTVSAAVGAAINNPAVRLARTAAQDLANAAGTVRAVVNAAELVANASSAPAALSALASLSASAGAMGDAVGAASARLATTSGSFGGASGNTLYRQEITATTGTLGQLAGASASVKTAANTLKGFF